MFEEQLEDLKKWAKEPTLLGFNVPRLFGSKYANI